MRLIGLAVVLTVGLTLAPLAAEAQEAGKVPRIGVLRPGNPPPGDFGQDEAFERGLRDLGWTSGTSTGTRRANPSACPSLRPI